MLDTIISTATTPFHMAKETLGYGTGNGHISYTPDDPRLDPNSAYYRPILDLEDIFRMANKSDKEIAAEEEAILKEVELYRLSITPRGTKKNPTIDTVSKVLEEELQAVKELHCKVIAAENQVKEIVSSTVQIQCTEVEILNKGIDELKKLQLLKAEEAKSLKEFTDPVSQSMYKLAVSATTDIDKQLMTLRQKKNELTTKKSSIELPLQDGETRHVVAEIVPN